MLLPRPLRGIVTPLITPLETPDSLDQPSLETLLEHVIDGGVAAVFVLGTTGEGPALPVSVRRQMVEVTCRVAANRVPVIVGITDSCLREALDLAEFSARAGAAAVVSAGPTYFPVAQAELERYIRQLADAAPLPLFLYNMPSHTHVRFAVPTVAAVAGHPNIAGLKDSSGEIMYLHALRHTLAQRPDFTLLVGPEEMMGESVLLGVHGGVNGGSNLFPSLYVQLYQAAATGDLPTLRRLHARVIDISQRLYCTGTYGSSYMQGLKCSAAQLKLCRNVLAPPYQPFDTDQVETIRRHLGALGVL